MRDDRRERDRYPRASLAEQARGELASLRRNPPLIWLLIAVVGGWVVLTVTTPQFVDMGTLTPGDCIYIRAADADTDAETGRPIGSDGAAISALFEQGAEKAPCDGSHSHEVADAFVLDEGLVEPYPGQGELTDRYRERCETAFEAHVGRPSEGSSFALSIAVPPPAPWEDGARAGTCLVSRRDGQFLGEPARGSGR